jgi:hypothetical protein
LGGAQTIAAANYGILSISGARTTSSVTLASAGTIGVACSLNATATFTTGGYVVTGSTVNYNGASQNVSTALPYNNLTFSGSGTKTTNSGTLTIGGNWSVGTAAALNTNNTVVNLTGAVSGAGSITQGSGLMTIGGDWTNTGTFSASSAGVTLTGSGKQITGPAAGITFTTLTVNGTYTNNNTGSGITVSTALSGSGTLTQGANSLLTLSGTSGITTLDAATNTPNTVVYNGSAAQTVKATTYSNLTVNNSSGVSITGNTTVNGTLTFTAGNFTTGSNTLTIGSAGAITGAGTSQHVIGNLAKVYSSAGSFTYAVGDASNYSPVTVNFSTLTTAGSLTVSVTNSDHPNTTSGTSGVDYNKDINRYWTMKNPTLAGTYTALFNYVNGSPVDRDSGAAASNMVIEQGSTCSGTGGGRTCSTWAARTTRSSDCVSGTPSTTSACALSISVASGGAESDFALGEPVAANFARERQFIYTRELY